MKCEHLNSFSVYYNRRPAVDVRWCPNCGAIKQLEAEGSGFYTAWMFPQHGEGRVPEEKHPYDGPFPKHEASANSIWSRGWNDCRCAMLEGDTDGY